MLARAERLAAVAGKVPGETKTGAGAETETGAGIEVEVAMAEIVALARAIDLAEAAIAARLPIAEAGKGHHLFGRRSIGAWLAAATGSRTARAGERVTLSRQLPRLPHTAG
ncbi:hypothetical protein, partial [Microtetraspora malaysiensis]|uniref:hypothetical protein n=1 Tax=Microtetraspora malaysiensis TaxID=161358 RepID=UPI0012F91C86